MSDYERNRVVAYPISKELRDELDSINMDDPRYDLFGREKGYFKTEVYCNYDKDYKCNYYLVYILYNDYGVDGGEFGRGRELRDSEKEKYKKLFEQIIPVDENKFKYLDYTYYNCSEAPDYYVGRDPFEDEI